MTKTENPRYQNIHKILCV